MKRIRDCGRRPANPDGSVRVRATGSGDDRRSGFAGFTSCGSVWGCPVCSERILSGRQDEIASAAAAWQAMGGTVVMQTLTMRHEAGQALSELWDHLSYAWSKVVGGRPWQRLNDRYGSEHLGGRIGFARVVETTHGENGWHVHVHAGLFLPGTITADQLDDIRGTIFASWSSALQRRKLRAPLAAYSSITTAPGGDVRPLGDYFAKNVYDVDASRIALELARGDIKNARSGNRTPFRILSDFVAWGVADDLAVWIEWEQASRGRRQLTWSAGLRAVVLADVEERSDEELAAEELGGSDDDLVEIPADGVRMIARLGLHSAILDAAEFDETGSVLRHYLAARGVPFRDVGAFVG